MSYEFEFSWQMPENSMIFGLGHPSIDDRSFPPQQRSTVDKCRSSTAARRRLVVGGGHPDDLVDRRNAVNHLVETGHAQCRDAVPDHLVLHLGG